MQAIVNSEYGPPEDLKLEEIDPPELDEDGVLVRVRAASVNPYDWHMMRGEPYLVRLSDGLRRPKRTVRGVDMAGTVEAVGANVTQVAAGRRGVRLGPLRRARGVRARRRELVRAEAGTASRSSRPPRSRSRAAPRSRRCATRGSAAGAERPDQRRRRRRRHVRRADREGARRRGDRCVQHAERRPRPLARRRPGGRLHGGRLHRAGSGTT